MVQYMYFLRKGDIMSTRVCAFLVTLSCLLLLLAGCGENKNAPIIGKWEATKVNLNGETISFSELGATDKEFSFEFKEDGTCRAVLAGVPNEGTYSFNTTSVDISYGGKNEKLSYDSGVLTLCFNYNNEKTQYMFTKVQ